MKFLGSALVLAFVLMSQGAYGWKIGTGRVLDLLDRYGLKTTFFIPGLVIDQRPAVAEEILKRGHEIAHHSYSHAWILNLTPEQEREEMEKGFQSIKVMASSTYLLRGTSCGRSLLSRPSVSKRDRSSIAMPLLALPHFIPSTQARALQWRCVFSGKDIREPKSCSPRLHYPRIPQQRSRYGYPHFTQMQFSREYWSYATVQPAWCSLRGR